MAVPTADEISTLGLSTSLFAISTWAGLSDPLLAAWAAAMGFPEGNVVGLHPRVVAATAPGDIDSVVSELKVGPAAAPATIYQKSLVRLVFKAAAHVCSTSAASSGSGSSAGPALAPVGSDKRKIEASNILDPTDSGVLKRPAASASGTAVKRRRQACDLASKGAELATNDVESTVRGIAERVRAAMCDWPEALGMEGRRTLLKIHSSFNEHVMKAFSCGGPVDIEMIEAIRRYCPSGVVEIGGGLGYWARALSDVGVSVACFDKDPGAWSTFDLTFQGYDFEDSYKGQAPFFFPVEVGDVQKVAQYPRRGLLLVWPPAESGDRDRTMAADALESLPPTVVFVGRRSSCDDDPGTQTAGPIFFGLLHRHYTLVKDIRCGAVPDCTKWLPQDSKPKFDFLSTVSIWVLKTTAACTKAEDISDTEIGLEDELARHLAVEHTDRDADQKRAHLFRIETLITICQLEDVLLHRCRIEELVGSRSKARQLSGPLLRKLWKNLGLPVIPLPSFVDAKQRRQHLHHHLCALFGKEPP